MRHLYLPTRERLLQILRDSQREAARKNLTVKAKVLIDYLRPPDASAAPSGNWEYDFSKVFRLRPDVPLVFQNNDGLPAVALPDYLRALDAAPAARFENWEDEFVKAYGLRPDDPRVLRDNDGDVALAQPHAEQAVLSEAGSFGGALALILMAETCWDTSIGDPAHLAQALVRYRPLVAGGQPPSAALLHEFLEVEQIPEKWLFAHILRHRMVAGRDYGCLTNLDGTDDRSSPGCASGGVWLSPFMAAKVAVTTLTLRGRKMRGCMVEPGVRGIHIGYTDLALLHLLFLPPTRGLASF